MRGYMYVLQCHAQSWYPDTPAFIEYYYYYRITLVAR